MIVEACRNEETPPPACPRDGAAMTLVRVNPRLGALLELRTYRCGRCGAVETVEVKQLAPSAR